MRSIYFGSMDAGCLSPPQVIVTGVTKRLYDFNPILTGCWDTIKGK